MSLFDALAERLSLRSVAVLLALASALWLALGRVDEHRRLKRLGGKPAARAKSYVPSGIDFIAAFIAAVLSRTLVAFWRQRLVAPTGSWTCELRVVNQRLVFTAEPDNAKALLATQFDDFAKGEAFRDEWTPFLGDSIINTDGALWHASRQFLRPYFSRDRASRLQALEPHVQMLLKAVANGGPLDGDAQARAVDLSAADGRVVDMCGLFFRFTFDTVVDTFLGHDVKTLSTPNHAFAHAFDELIQIHAIRIVGSAFRRLIPRFRHGAHLRVVDGFINGLIERALRPASDSGSGPDAKDAPLLHNLSLRTRDPAVIRSQVTAVLFAGRDTTAATLSWAIYELARHPEAVARLRREVLDVVGPDEPPTYRHLGDMPYLQAVLNETLRLYPAIGFNIRTAVRDTTLPRGGGPDGSQPLPVLKGTQVIYSTLVMQRRPDLYPPVSDSFADPAVFSPDRWARWHPRPHEYIPFSAGPRICVGQKFVLTQMAYVLCRIFQHFSRVESHMLPLDGGDPVLDTTKVILKPGQGVHVAFYRD